MKMNKKIQVAFLTLVFFVFLTANVSASVTIDIEIDSQFTVGERISFNYTFVSDVDEEINYMANVNCPEAPQPLLEIKSTILEKNALFEEEYVYMGIVRENIESQNCSAIVAIIEPFETSENKSFEILTKSGFEFRVVLCEDQSCLEPSKVFVRNSDIFLDYSSDVDNPSITAALTFPDKTTQTLTLPTSIKAEQIGTHTLDITASKEGYKTMSVKEQFGVIEQEADIPSVSVCNANGICDNQENYQNCPQDCAYPADKSSKKTNYLATILITIIVLFLVFLIIIISVKIFKIIRRRRFRKIGGIKKLEARKKGIDLKKLELKKDFQKELKEKERTFKKKKRFLDKLLWRKKKASGKEQEVLGRKLKHDRNLLSGKKLEIKKELGKKFETKKKLLKFKETGLEKEKKVVRDKSQK